MHKLSSAPLEKPPKFPLSTPSESKNPFVVVGAWSARDRPGDAFVGETRRAARAERVWGEREGGVGGPKEVSEEWEEEEWEEEHEVDEEEPE